jgi:hypothetical protein
VFGVGVFSLDVQNTNIYCVFWTGFRSDGMLCSGSLLWDLRVTLLVLVPGGDNQLYTSLMPTLLFIISMYSITPLIRIGLALGVNLLRIQQN